MFGLGAATHIYLAPGATDMRKGFDGLYGLVGDKLLCDPLSGHVFLFSNAQKNRLKILFSDSSGVFEAIGEGARPIAVGRKNWIHLGSAQAGPKIAAIFSVVESCRRLNIRYVNIWPPCYLASTIAPSSASLNLLPWPGPMTHP